MEHKSDFDTNCKSVVLGTVTNVLVQRLEDLEIRRRIRDHPDYSIIKISQNTEKSPGDIRRLAFTQTSVKDHKTDVKNSQGVNSNNDNNGTSNSKDKT